MMRPQSRRFAAASLLLAAATILVAAFVARCALSAGDAEAAAKPPASDEERLVAVLAAGDRGNKLLELSKQIAERDGAKAIPWFIGLIDSDNSYDTVYWVGHFTLAPLTDVEYSPLHDGAWWRRWWKANRDTFPEETRAMPIPTLKKTEHGRRYVPFPPETDTLEGKFQLAADLLDERARKNRRVPELVSLGDVAREIARHDDPRAIPFLIGLIDADNSYDTVYGVGYFSLRPLTGVDYSTFHDGAWWRRWWEANRQDFPEEARATAIPVFDKTEHGRKHVPFPAELDTLQGKLRFAYEILDRGERKAEQQVRQQTTTWNIASEIAKHEDPHAIPYLIGLVDFDRYGIGWYGLNKLTGVDYDESHDGAWWRRWWQENKSKYPADVQAIEIPDDGPLTLAWKEPTAEEKKRIEDAERQAAMADVADIPAQDLTVEGNDRMRYFLIGPKRDAVPPQEGFKLVVVMPGGDGSEDFHPFVRRLYKHAMTDAFLVAQPVAVRWSNGQKIVWPTKLNPERKQEFATEDFIEAVIEDVSRRQPVDPRHVYTLSWSSSGPAAYAVALQETTAVTGSYVAMSVFRPDQLPSLGQAKGRGFLLDHSPQDKVCPFRDAERAQRELGDAGATVRLVTYEGGHGWRGPLYRRVADGLSWLVERSDDRGE